VKFLKKNRSRFPDHLLCEARGLAVLRDAASDSGIDVPEVFHVDEQTLSMTRIEATGGTTDQWVKLGRGLSGIHARSNDRFGFFEDNYIGLNPQPNGFESSWGRFFLKNRLEFQLGMMSGHRAHASFFEILSKHGTRLVEFLDSQCNRPSLLHGDLWNGNVVFGSDGRVWLIDPAVYFGDPDADLAMTEMFSGFAAAFYSAYRKEIPQSPAYAIKRRIYNLYHYLNHRNLFGDGYLEGCEAGFAAIEGL
jgi:fructosamine-3-kinase